MSDRAAHLLDLARQAGAEAAEVYQTHSVSRPVSFEANRLKQLETNASAGVALRLWKNGCPGLTVAYGAVEPQTVVERALALAALNPPETAEFAPARQERYPSIGPAEVPVADLVTRGKAAIERIRDAYPETICSIDLEWEWENTRLVNSEGLDCQSEDASLGLSLGVEWVRGEDFLGVYDGVADRALPDCDIVINRILQRLAWAENNVAAPSGNLPVLFVDKAADLLWGIAAAALNGKRIVEGASPWSDRLGDTVAVPDLTLRQEPSLGPSSSPFDDEGTPTQTFDLIRAGRVAQFYCDRATGRQLGGGSTGNGIRPSLGRYPTPGLVNLTVAPGKGGSLTDLISDLDRAIVVDQTLGGGPDLSGEFSLNLDLGYYIENGQVRGRVKDTAIAGNAYTALNSILALGSDRRWVGSCLTPAVLVESLSILGG